MTTACTAGSAAVCKAWSALLRNKMAERFASVSEDELCEKCIIKQLLNSIFHDIMNYQNRGLCYLPKPKAEADNTDTRF